MEKQKHTPMDGRYYAEGQVVRKAANRTIASDGGKCISLDFPVCRMHEAAEGQAKVVAHLLNRGTAAPMLLAALEEIRSRAACFAETGADPRIGDITDILAITEAAIAEAKGE
ncbi:hypothetical protein [Telmatospirillum sp. J64-1]|uniref:hypothetical protein n=1 Tax=Telmatospirillum sp. J64-1 TaxID=2502183 RepID=UPI00115C56B9|nr:hypothetical protein [Telmatospirillum sp. J64-1]